MASAFELSGAAPVSTEQGTAVVTAGGEVVQQSFAGSKADVIEVKKKRRRSSSRKRSSPPKSAPTPLTPPKEAAPVVEQKSPEVKKDFVDQSTGRTLTPYEAAVVQSRGGGQSVVKPNTFGQEGEERFISTSNKAQKTTALNLTPTVQRETILRGAAGIVKEDQTLKAIDREIKQAIQDQDKDRLKILQKERAAIVEDRILRSSPSYGKFEPLKEGEKATPKRVFQQFAGIESKGLEYIGTGGELFLQQSGEKIQASNLPQPLKSFLGFETKLAQGVISGAITTPGTDKTTAIITAATLGAGGLFGAGQGVFQGVNLGTGAAKVIATTGKVGGVLLVTAGVGAAGFKIATAEDKIKAVGEVGGEVLLFGSAFTTGQKTGLAAVQSTKKGAAQLFAKSTEGKVLTTTEARKIERLQKAGVLSSEVVASPIEGVSGVRVTTPARKGFLTREKKTFTRGELQKVNPSEAASDGFLLDINKLDFKLDKDFIATAGEKGLVPEGTIVPIREFSSDFVSSKGKVFVTRKKFFKEFNNKEIVTYESTSALATEKPSAFGTAIKGDVYSASAPKSEPSVSFAFNDLGTAIPFKPKQIPVNAKFSDSKIYTVDYNPKTSEFTLSDTKGGKQVFIVEKVSPQTESFATVDVGGGQVAKVSFAQKVASATSKAKAQKQETIFKPLKTYQGGDASFNPAEKKPQSNAFAVLRSETITEGASSVSDAGSKSTIIEESGTAIKPIISTSQRSSRKSTFDTSRSSKTSETNAIDSIIDSSSKVSTTSAIDSITGSSSAIATESIISTQEKTISSKVSDPFKQKQTQKALVKPFRRTKQKDLFQQGYDVEVRTKGIFKRISSSPLSLRDAKALGSSIAGSTSAATFRVLKSSGAAKGFFRGRSQIQDFEARPGGLFIEKREKRINKPGELFEITAKGQATIRNRRIFK